MNRRQGLLAVACASVVWAGALGVAPAPAHGAERGIVLREVDLAAYPDLSVEVTGAPLSGPDLPSSAFKLTEGGTPVAASVERIIDRSLDLVVVVDSSGSMAGSPIQAARQAAGAFISALPATARVGVIAFGARPTLLQPLSTTRPAQLAAVARITAAGETALHDGLVLAADQLRPSTASRRAIVVLSDGGDTVSATPFGQALEAVRGVGANVSVVELTTGETDHDALALLAGSTGGTLVAAADSPALSGAFRTLRADLDGRYVVHYRTHRSGRTNVSLQATTPTGTFRAGRLVDVRGRVLAPAEQAKPASPRMLGEPAIWASPIVRASGLGALALAIAITAWVLFLPGKRRSRLVDRIGGRGATTAGPPLADLTARATAAAERALDRHDRRTSIDRLLEQGGIAMRSGELAVLVLAVTAAAALVGLLVAGPLLSLAAALVPALVAKVVLTRRRRRRLDAFADQLESIVQFLAGSLRAGYAVSQALESASQEFTSPASDELRRVTTEVRLGRDLGDALDSMGTRVGSEDFAWVVQAIRINREIGGDLAEILDRVAETVRSRASIRRQVRALSAEGRMSACVLLALPPGVAAMLAIVNRSYFAELVDNSLGLTMVAFAVAMMTAGAFWIRRLVQLDY